MVRNIIGVFRKGLQQKALVCEYQFIEGGSRTQLKSKFDTTLGLKVLKQPHFDEVPRFKFLDNSPKDIKTG